MTPAQFLARMKKGTSRRRPCCSARKRTSGAASRTPCWLRCHGRRGHPARSAGTDAGGSDRRCARAFAVRLGAGDLGVNAEAALPRGGAAAETRTTSSDGASARRRAGSAGRVPEGSDAGRGAGVRGDPLRFRRRGQAQAGSRAQVLRRDSATWWSCSGIRVQDARAEAESLVRKRRACAWIRRRWSCWSKRWARMSRASRWRSRSCRSTPATA